MMIIITVGQLYHNLVTQSAQISVHSLFFFYLIVMHEVQYNTWWITQKSLLQYMYFVFLQSTVWTCRGKRQGSRAWFVEEEGLHVLRELTAISSISWTDLQFFCEEVVRKTLLLRLNYNLNVFGGFLWTER